ncbi:MAG: hypothetical protein JWN67_2781 [Actinomycetia bacterium]|nr:hypothetical protein [Actinomycetes bacterium]
MYTQPADPADERDAIAAYLTPAVTSVWHALDAGRTAADEFFTDERRAYDPHLWAHITRYEAALSLRAASAGAPWKLKPKHHSGVDLVMEPFVVKLCKAAGDAPQSTGRNPARRRFYQQMDMFGGANLLLHWKVEDGELRLGLSKPKGWWKFKASPKLEWSTDVTFDPLAGLRFTPVAETDERLILDEDIFGEGEFGG